MKPSDYIRKGWTQGERARTAGGWRCSPASPKAIAWCLLGSVVAAYWGKPKRLNEAETKIYKVLPEDEGIAFWNDDLVRTQAEVLALLESVGE